jgi:hypothetical protein
LWRSAKRNKMFCTVVPAVLCVFRKATVMCLGRGGDSFRDGQLKGNNLGYLQDQGSMQENDVRKNPGPSPAVVDVPQSDTAWAFPLGY